MGGNLEQSAILAGSSVEMIPIAQTVLFMLIFVRPLLMS